MIAKVNDFFTSITKRFANPLFSSFIIAWLVFNWRIIIVLIFYNLNTLKIEKCDSYIEYIETFSNWTLFWGPISSALSYTFIFPFIRNGILAFDAWIKTWGNLEHRENYDRQTEDLAKIIKNEGEFAKKYEKISEENIELLSSSNLIKQEHIVLADQYNKLKEENKYQFGEIREFRKELRKISVDNRLQDILGEWLYYADMDTEPNKSILVLIKDREIYRIDNHSKPVNLLYEIEDIISNPKHNNFVLVLTPSENAVLTYQLRNVVQVLHFNDNNHMEGRNDNKRSIIYVRKINTNSN